MTLLVDELFPGVVFTQNFRIKRSMQLAHFRPWIIKWGNPADGEMVLQILQNDEVLKEVRLTSEEINANITATYFHGQLRFDTEPLQLNHYRKAEWTEYQVKIFMDGYTKDATNFYGIVRRYENKIYPTYGDGVVDGEPLTDTLDPMGFELFEYTY
jgi:hypothetical protein